MSDLISRAEAKEALRERLKRIPTYAIWAMHTIDELPTHPTPSNTLGALDCIERQAAIDAFWKLEAELRPSAIDAVLDMLKNLPSAQPERKKGKWIGYNADDKDWQRDDGSPIFMNCSECHEAVINNGSAHWNFCPNCGCRMEEGDSE